jgi:Tol biopolymer transport system component
VSVSISPASANALVNQTATFTATVTNSSDGAVTWSIKEANAGTVVNGLFKAPGSVGTYHVVATSVADPTKSATATVDVGGQFLSLQKLVAGANLPWSVTPFLTMFSSNGTWNTSGFVDQQMCGLDASCKPLDINAFDVYLSADGKKAVATIPAPGTYSGDSTYFWNIAIADLSTLAVTQLTHNENNQNFYTQDWTPQLSPDGKLIVFSHIGASPNTGMNQYGIATMSTDGSNWRPVIADDSKYADFPTFSPNGTKVAAYVSWYDPNGDGYGNGVATLNVDGSGYRQLTNGIDNSNSLCIDTMPAYTSDGKQIVFARECMDWNVGGYYDTLFIMNADGTNVTALHGQATVGIMACQPRGFANNQIVFSSNENAPGTDSFDMYSIMPDGTKLTRITDNNVYDGFSVWWMNYNTTTAAARAVQRSAPLQRRMDHLKWIQQIRETHKAR